MCCRSVPHRVWRIALLREKLRIALFCLCHILFKYFFYAGNADLIISLTSEYIIARLIYIAAVNYIVLQNISAILRNADAAPFVSFSSKYDNSFTIRTKCLSIVKLIEVSMANYLQMEYQWLCKVNQICVRSISYYFPTKLKISRKINAAEPILCRIFC